MANRMTMRKIKEILRLHFEVGLSNREIARSLSLSHTTVSELFGRFQSAGMLWPLPEGIAEAALEVALYPGNTGKSRRRPEPDWAEVHRELSRKGVTLQLLSSSTRTGTLTVTSTPSSASATGSGEARLTRSCARFTGPARRSSWTTPA